MESFLARSGAERRGAARSGAERRVAKGGMGGLISPERLGISLVALLEIVPYGLVCFFSYGICPSPFHYSVVVGRACLFCFCFLSVGEVRSFVIKFLSLEQIWLLLKLFTSLFIPLLWFEFNFSVSSLKFIS